MSATYANPFQIFYLANCGLLIQAGSRRMLIDGLMAGKGAFDEIPPTALQLLMDGCEPYGAIDLLLFTHAHFDHLDQEKTAEFLGLHPQTKALLPSGAALALAHVPDSQMTAVSGSGGTFFPFPGEPLQINYVLTSHISFPCPEHYCICIRSGSNSLLLTGDMDFDQLPQLAERLSLTALQTGPAVCRQPAPSHLTVFCNPILLGKEKWVRTLSDLRPDHVFIYHIPAEKLDQFSYRKMALRRKDRYEQLLPQLTLLLQPMTPI